MSCVQKQNSSNFSTTVIYFIKHTNCVVKVSRNKRNIKKLHKMQNRRIYFYYARSKCVGTLKDFFIPFSAFNFPFLKAFSGKLMIFEFNDFFTPLKNIPKF